jgi:hypothetical protein
VGFRKDLTIERAEIAEKIPGSLGIAVIYPHIWRRDVSQIVNPTYIWRRVTEIPKEPDFHFTPN